MQQCWPELQNRTFRCGAIYLPQLLKACCVSCQGLHSMLCLILGLGSVKGINKKADLVHKDDWHMIEPRRVIFFKTKVSISADFLFLERKTRLELATPTLARLCSTNWATSAFLFSQTLFLSFGIAKVRKKSLLPNFFAKIFKKKCVFYRKSGFYPKNQGKLLNLSVKLLNLSVVQTLKF